MRNKIYGGRPNQKWALIVGSDTSDSDWGLTLFYQPKPVKEQDGISAAWRHIWRLTIRWPATLRHQRPKSFPRSYMTMEEIADEKTLIN